MGAILSAIYNRMEEARILMVGLDNSGKTTILYKLKNGKAIQCEPTITFNLEKIDYKDIRFTFWDIGSVTRPLWTHYLANTQAVVFVFDASDRFRIQQAVDEFQSLINREELRGSPVLILAHKQDLSGSMSMEEVRDHLNLDELLNHRWHVQPTSIFQEQSLYTALDWLHGELSNKI